MERIVNLLLLFAAYSFVGWCIEVTLKFFQYRRFINRGFLTGPVLPIYGSGAALITVAVSLLPGAESGYGTTFAVSFVLCGAVEYGTSYYLEKRFQARWWDYSQKPMNLHGRVWIGNLVLFGLGGVLIVKGINPILYRLFAAAPLSLREGAAILFFLLFTADYIGSHFILKLVKDGVDRSEADDTEAIGREIRTLLSDRSAFHKRFADAYPEVVYRTERVRQRMEAIRRERERLLREAEKRMEKVQDRLNDELEPGGRIKNTILADQQELIALLYDEDKADERERELHRRIEENRERLSRRPLQPRSH
ncbi:MAG: putative ABC transporter permease [Oscillospiraceae bacterium]|nr:putative ABC transporter permease [Oscillospiraceae bacterium]